MDGLAAAYLIDQTRLPLRGDILCCKTHEGLCTAIKSLAVRGAPALGVAAAFAVALWSENESDDTDVDSYLASLDAVVETVASARPTAVNLSWGAERIRTLARDNAEVGLAELKKLVLAEAKAMAAADEACNRAIGENGAPLLPENARILTHCNAGSLATAYYGTALGVVFTASMQGRVGHVWVDETRPVNQGSRLTSWELMIAGIPSTLICDNMAASVMGHGWVDAIIVGADRVCKNGDTANKIGTYALAVLAHAHGIPFYVACPTSTIDLAIESGEGIEIEVRDTREVEGVTVAGIIIPDAPEITNAFDAITAKGDRALSLKNGHEMVISRKGGGYAFDAWFRTTPPGVQVYNPAFDVTPARFITAIITDTCVLRPNDDGEFDCSLAFDGVDA